MPAREREDTRAAAGKDPHTGLKNPATPQKTTGKDAERTRKQRGKDPDRRGKIPVPHTTNTPATHDKYPPRRRKTPVQQTKNTRATVEKHPRRVRQSSGKVPKEIAHPPQPLADRAAGLGA